MPPGIITKNLRAYNTRKAHPWGGLDIKSVCVVTPPRTGVCPGLHSIVATHAAQRTAAYATLSCCLHFAAPDGIAFFLFFKPTTFLRAKLTTGTTTGTTRETRETRQDSRHTMSSVGFFGAITHLAQFQRKLAMTFCINGCDGSGQCLKLKQLLGLGCRHLDGLEHRG